MSSPNYDDPAVKEAWCDNRYGGLRLVPASTAPQSPARPIEARLEADNRPRRSNPRIPSSHRPPAASLALSAPDRRASAPQPAWRPETDAAQGILFLKGQQAPAQADQDHKTGRGQTA
jgi:hypothetical protein